MNEKTNVGNQWIFESMKPYKVSKLFATKPRNYTMT